MNSCRATTFPLNFVKHFTDIFISLKVFRRSAYFLIKKIPTTCTQIHSPQCKLNHTHIDLNRIIYDKVLHENMPQTQENIFSQFSKSHDSESIIPQKF